MTKNPMIQQIASLPELIRTETEPIYRKLRTLLTPAEIFAVKRIVLTGCGDSYFAGLATEMAFETVTGLPVEVMSSMPAARYGLLSQPKSFPRSPLVAAVSVSGEVSRTVEAINIARAEGALTLGITATANSRLALAAEKTLDCTVPSFPDAPGVRSYRVSLISLWMLAIRMAEVTGKISQDDSANLVRKFILTADPLEKTIQTWSAPVQQLAKNLAHLPHSEFVGHGPNLASALFCAAKVVEAAGLKSSGQDTEEWAHLEYFLIQDPQTPTFILSPGDRGHGRAAELLEPMRRVGRTIVAVVPQGDNVIAPHADLVLPVSGLVDELFTPAIYCVAGELYAAYLAEALQEGYFRSGRQAYKSGNNGIRSSRILLRSEI